MNEDGTSTVPWDDLWWRRWGLLLTSVVFIVSGGLFMFAQDRVTPVTPLAAIIAGVLVSVFTIIPWSRMTYRAAGMAGFGFLTFTALRLLGKAISEGISVEDSADAAALAYTALFIYFAALFSVLWITAVKPWHNIQWARHDVSRKQRG